MPYADFFVPGLIGTADRLHDVRGHRDHARHPARQRASSSACAARRSRRRCTSARSRARWRSCSRSRPRSSSASARALLDVLGARRAARAARARGVRRRSAFSALAFAIVPLRTERRGLVGRDLGAVYLPLLGLSGRVLPAAPAAGRAAPSSPTCCRCRTCSRRCGRPTAGAGSERHDLDRPARDARLGGAPASLIAVRRVRLGARGGS